MKKETVYFVTFLRTGLMFAEDWTREVKTKYPTDVEWPDEAYCFTLHERQDVIYGDDRFKGEPKQIGPIYFHPDSKVENLEQVKARRNAGSILISNMECNHWEFVVWSRWGNWPQPFDPKTHAVLPK